MIHSSKGCSPVIESRFLAHEDLIRILICSMRVHTKRSGSRNQLEDQLVCMNLLFRFESCMEEWCQTPLSSKRRRPALLTAVWGV